MKKYFKLSLFALMAVVLFFTSCTEDDFDPFADPVDKFLGNWQCQEEGDVSGSGWNYPVRITRNPENSAEILIDNFNLQGNGEKARALITGNTMTIPRQKICDDTIEIQGSGTYSNNEISFNYTTNDGATQERFSGRYYKP